MKQLEDFSSSEDELESAMRPKSIKKKEGDLDTPIDLDFEQQIL